MKWPRLFSLLALACACWVPVGAPGQTNQSLVLADVEGFSDGDTYPPGNLQPVTDGGALWQPSSPTPGLITNLNDGGLHGVVLRRTQTGADNTDYLKFPEVSNGVLTVQFDARASTPGTRTLDVFVLPTSGGETSLLGWGTVSNKLSYYDGANWIAILDLNTNWHHIEMINYLSGSNFGKWDLKVDNSLVGANLPWRNNHPLGTPYGRVRFGGIRGVAGTYADVDNLLITAEVPVTPPDTLVLTNAAGSTADFAFSFQTKTNTEYLVETVGSLVAPDWSPLAIVPGSGREGRFTNQPATNLAEFYRVKRLPPTGYADGYRGIWFTLGQFSIYGDKYSGGLGTYTANHIPIAIYCAEVNKTFFLYGGTIKDQRHLLIMASCFDHATRQVPRPTLVLDKQGVNDPHDNAALAIDGQGYLWVFVSGRATARPGWKFRAKKPYSVAEFEFIRQDEMTYPQPRFIPGFGFFNLFTKYTNGRELYWETSTNGINWSAHQKLAGIGGHYQVSNVRSDGLVATFFNRHPGGDVDKRTDLYYLQTTNYGVTWTTASGLPVSVPLTTTNNPARVMDYASLGELMYTCDLNFDTNGHPVLLYIVSHNYQPGPAGDPRTWTIARWTGSQWVISAVCQSDHNYDMGSLYIQPDRWLIIGPTQNGPQLWQAGGEMALWSSQDLGQTWTMLRQITTNSVYNHTYARRPLNAKDPFFAFWADGDPTQFTPSRLYFGNSDGTRVWQLPYDMPTPLATPQEVDPTMRTKDR
jgi:BNR repeat-containing family member